MWTRLNGSRIYKLPYYDYYLGLDATYGHQGADRRDVYAPGEHHYEMK